MILTCPQCTTRFVVPSTAIPDEGRKVRCAQCQHVWEQKPVIVKETQSSDAQPSSETKIKMPPIKLPVSFAWLKAEFLEGYKSFLGGLSFVLICFFVYQWLSPQLIIGQGVAFNNMTIEREENNLIVSGEIVNTMNERRGVPSIRMTLIHGEAQGDSMLYATGIDVLKSAETIPVSYTLHDVPLDVTDLKIGFEIAKPSQNDESVPTEGPVHSE